MVPQACQKLGPEHAEYRPKLISCAFYAGCHTAPLSGPTLPLAAPTSSTADGAAEAAFRLSAARRLENHSRTSGAVSFVIATNASSASPVGVMELTPNAAPINQIGTYTYFKKFRPTRSPVGR